MKKAILVSTFLIVGVLGFVYFVFYNESGSSAVVNSNVDANGYDPKADEGRVVDRADVAMKNVVSLSESGGIESAKLSQVDLRLLLTLRKELGGYLQLLSFQLDDSEIISDAQLEDIVVVSGLYLDELKNKRLSMTSVSKEDGGRLEIFQDSFAEFGLALREEYMNVLEDVLGDQGLGAYEKSLREHLDLHYFHGWGTGATFIDVSQNADGTYNVRVEDVVSTPESDEQVGDAQRLALGNGRSHFGGVKSFSEVTLGDLEGSLQTDFIVDLIGRYK